MRRFFFLTLILVGHVTLFLAFPQKTDSALQLLAFLSGRWTNNSTEGKEEEYCSPTTGSSMVGTFRGVKDGKAVFYEFWNVEVENGNAVFKMKHFDRGLIGWEDKADAVRLALSVDHGQDVSFSQPDDRLSLRYQRKGDELMCTLRRVKNGKTSEDFFHLHRKRGMTSN
jgi:hypothetical protein